MAEIIFAEQTLTPFTYVESFGAYASTESSPTFKLTAGEVYTVIWDGEMFVRTAFAFTAADGASCVGVGNELVKGGSNTGEPFGIICDLTNNYIHYVSTETDTSHTVALYKGEVVFAEQTLGFSKNEERENYLANTAVLGIDPAVLAVGNTYTVVWDGVQYVCVAENMTFSGLSGIGIGNKSVEGIGEDTGEPFLIGYMPDVPATAFSTLDTSASHTVAIYVSDYLMYNQTLSFALQGGSETLYYNDPYADGIESAPAIVSGNTYTVIWDGSYFQCVAKDYSLTDGSATATIVVLGNLSIRFDTEEDTGEPFVYLFIGSDVANFTTLETDASHVVSIYDGVLEEPDEPSATTANIVLLDRNGNSVTYEGIKTVSFNTPDGKIATFTLSAISS